MSGSCFAEHLKHFVDLTSAEHDALVRLEDAQRALARGDILQRQGEPIDEMFVLKHGRLMSYVVLDDGSRQILRHYYAGDFVGTSNAVYRCSSVTIVAVDAVTVCPFDKQGLRNLLEEHPRVAAMMFALAQAERVALIDRLASIGRMPAKGRVAALLLDIHHRNAMLHDAVPASFNPQMTQEEMGDATGLTSVHVNRMMRELVDDRLITRSGPLVTIVDLDRMKRIGNYVDRHRDLDFSWLPAPRR